jgi:hypothetical protein
MYFQSVLFMTRVQCWLLRSKLDAPCPEEAVPWDKHPSALRAVLVLLRRAALDPLAASSTLEQNLVDAVFSHVFAQLWKRDNEVRGLPAKYSLTTNVLGCLRLNMESAIATLTFMLANVAAVVGLNIFAYFWLLLSWLTSLVGTLLLPLGK